MRIALCQMTVVDNKNTNLETASRMIKEASSKGADIVVLPEMFNCPYSNEHFHKYAEKENGYTFSQLSEWAAEHGLIIVGGSIPEKSGAHVYNTSFVFNSNGQCLGKHRKAHLFDIDVPGGITFKESETLTAGNTSTVIDTEFGKMGLAICYDIRFPELFRKMVLEGAQFIIVPAAFNMTTGPAHWELTARARALDNQVFMALCSPARDDDGLYKAYGHTLVTSPWGDVIAALKESEGLLMVDIELEKEDEVRRNLPLLKHRKPEMY
ncbi:carbon-nitrogen hydrolase family protein [Fusibacter sp. JL216-2]|uniref:carbon-nitrogen hydrolase family protein n=1 Tax=Fusibacter sp. JL216-2 TaxID=3071453 RepID=UPI003D333A38